MTKELVTYEKQFLLDDNQWQLTWKQCQIMVKSGFLPTSINTVEKAATIVLMGKELGLAPMTAINNISVIKGKPTLEAKLMLSLVLKKYPTAYYRVAKNTPEIAEIHLGRDKESHGIFTFTIEQAKAAGLTGKDNWKNYPADMLLWRAVARACRIMFPDVLTVTAHTRDEIEQPPTIVIEPEKVTEKIEEPQKEDPRIMQQKHNGPKRSTNTILDQLIPGQEMEQ